MKLVVVGHPLLSAYQQQKYVAMKRLDPALRLRLLVPTRWCERFEPKECEIHPALSRDEVVPLQAWPRGSHMWHLHNPVRVAAILRTFKPDVIHLDPGEPQALLSVEMIALQGIFARASAITLFTVDNLLRRRRFPLSLVKSGLRRYSLSRTSAMVCCNRGAAALLQAERRFAGPVEVLPQFGMDVAEHQPGRESGLRSILGLEGAPVIGYAGRMVAEKGLRHLFAALRSLSHYPWKLLLVGSGPLESEIRQLWMPQLPGRIVLVGAVPYESVAHYLRCLDIFVLASYATPTGAEQFGVTLAQAMMLGIPCVASTCGAIPEVLGPGGICFPERSAPELARALESLLRDPVLRDDLGMHGRQFALEHYTVEKVAEKYLAFFEQARQCRAAQPVRKSQVEFEPLSGSRHDPGISS